MDKNPVALRERAGHASTAATVRRMDWPAFWTTTFASSGAAAIGFGTAAWVFWRTRVADRKDAAERERRERVVEVQAAILGNLTRALAWRVIPVGVAVPKVAEAVAGFAASEMTVHPAVATWAVEQLSRMGELATNAARWWLFPGDGRRRAALLANATDLAMMLIAWESGAVSDSWFDERLSEEGRKSLTISSSRHRRGRARHQQRADSELRQSRDSSS